VTAEVDREANRVAVSVTAPRLPDPRAAEAERPARLGSLSLYLDEGLVDMRREVVVRVDGEERWRGVPEPRLAVLVRSAEEREDPRYTFPAETGPLGPR